MNSLKIGLMIYPLGGYLFSQAVVAGGTPAGGIFYTISLFLLALGVHFVAAGIEEITRRKR